VTQPLSGIKVLDFSEHGFVPSAAAVLADWGADVIKVERPEGDPMREIISQGLVADVDGYDYLFQLVNRNKRGISIDVLAPEGRAVFERLVRWADVYITNQLPRVRRKLHTEPEDLFALNPRLVVARGHGQGQRGEGAEQGGFDAVSFWCGPHAH
jgi:crotonobetainyl-CoA:carnitine CoA-transferase CaiB-like acyl-CoA transferase